MTVFVKEPVVENNTVSECIRAVEATMVVKFYNCKQTNTYTKESVNDTPRISVHATYKKKDYRVQAFLHCLNSIYMFQN